MINLKDFLTGNEVLHTEAFQKAVDTASASKQTLFVPVGTYLLGTVELKSDTSILFEDGAVLLGSKNLDDFYADEFLTSPLYQDVSHSSYTKSLFYATDVKNISLKGRAYIDMQSQWEDENKRGAYHRGAKVISIKNSENITITDLQIHNATDLAILLGRCKTVFIRGLYLRTHIDGISPDGSENVIISDCNLLCGDDAIVFKTSLYDGKVVPCKHITVSNCVISSRCNAIKFGTETTGDMKYITINNCTIYNVRCTGISIESIDGANIEAVNISNVMMENVACPIFMVLGRRMRAPEGTPIGSIKNVSISNIYADNNDKPYKSIDFWYPAICEGSEYQTNDCITSNIVNMTDNPFENVTLTNVHLKVLGGKTIAESSFIANPTGYADGAMFGKVLPASGLFVKGVKNATLQNVTVETVDKDERPTILVE
ncbi:MAG: right-handed parallel beta-helix repeat-containing protein [Clostridia bacterium]|nr:right-handed parallel beta-helix repeat-containing protein [Clostridia bacterium]